VLLPQEHTVHKLRAVYRLQAPKGEARARDVSFSSGVLGNLFITNVRIIWIATAPCGGDLCCSVPFIHMESVKRHGSVGDGLLIVELYPQLVEMQGCDRMFCLRVDPVSRLEQVLQEISRGIAASRSSPTFGVESGHQPPRVTDRGVSGQARASPPPADAASEELQPDMCRPSSRLVPVAPAPRIGDVLGEQGCSKHGTAHVALQAATPTKPSLLSVTLSPRLNVDEDTPTAPPTRNSTDSAASGVSDASTGPTLHGRRRKPLKKPELDKIPSTSLHEPQCAQSPKSPGVLPTPSSRKSLAPTPGSLQWSAIDVPRAKNVEAKDEPASISSADTSDIEDDTPAEPISVDSNDGPGSSELSETRPSHPRHAQLAPAGSPAVSVRSKVVFPQESPSSPSEPSSSCSGSVSSVEPYETPSDLIPEPT